MQVEIIGRNYAMHYDVMHTVLFLCVVCMWRVVLVSVLSSALVLMCSLLLMLSSGCGCLVLTTSTTTPTTAKDLTFKL